MGQPNSKPDTFDEKKAEMLSSCQDICQGVQDITLDKEYPSNLSPEQLEQFSCQFWKLDKNVLAMNAVMNNDPLDVMVNPSVRNQDQHVFNVKIETEGVATNQKQSGRCWLFAGTNVLRRAVIRKYNLNEDFELSQSFLFFYDKLEKANWFLENMIDLKDKEINDRVVQYLLSDPIGDGGQYDMFVNLVEKYGVVPKQAYPETVASSSTGRLNWMMTVKLREFAATLRAQEPNVARMLKEQMMQAIYRVLVIFLGEPPKEFRFETHDKNGKFVGLPVMTPIKFMKDVVAYPISKTMSLINDPRNDYNHLYTVDRLGNVVGGRLTRYVNTDSDQLKKLAIQVLKSGSPVWFGCDVGKFSSRKYGVMDLDIHDYKLGFDIEFNLSKADRLILGESLMTHAMVFTGVHVVDGKPVRWRVENSWSDTSGEKGFWVMRDSWFDEYVYQIVLETSAVPSKLVDLLDTEPIVLPAYDPMGALASPY